MQTTIKSLYKKGYSKTHIAKVLHVSRKTVRKVIQSDERGDMELVKKPHPSMLDQFKEFIEIQFNKGLSRQRIYQDLVKEYNYTGSYSAVRDYVRKFESADKKVYMVINTLPGEEAQVDFGYIGTVKVNEKPKKAWVFVMSLSYSRYMYACIVFDQSVKTFIQCHVNAFRYFGGVPETVKIDNLKAAIAEADFYEPVTQRTYAAFASHYGFWAQPCRVYTPTDKGKVESNIKYVKDNCFKGRSFKDDSDARDFLDTWLKSIANKRIHGTTKKIPVSVFEEIEESKLKALPKDDFVFSKSSIVSVNSNCHISYAGNYYSVPYGYIGCEVDVIEINNIIKIFLKGKEIALHTLCLDKKGEHITDKNHYPINKNITIKEILSSQEIKMAEIGDHALTFFRAFCNKGKIQKYDYRTISGILSLRNKYKDNIIDQACCRALYYSSVTYGTVKSICEKGLIALPVEHNQSFISDENVNNDLSHYNQLSRLGVIENE